jgi:hypothetical protein
MRFLTILIATLNLGMAESPDPPAKKTTSAPVTKAPARLSAKGKAPARKSSAATYAHQSGPTPDRCRQIQESLIAKGYMQGEPTGVWDQNSVDAMKKLQNELNIEPTGKITSKALISLGLGPSSESAPPIPK